MLIYKDKIFISYTDEIKEDCWNTSIIFGEINFEKIEFENSFTSQKNVLTQLILSTMNLMLCLEVEEWFLIMITIFCFQWENI